MTVTKPTTEIAITIPPNRSKEERGVAVVMASRVKAVRRRGRATDTPHVLSAGGLSVDLDHRIVTADGQRLQLTYKEFELLRLFLSHPGMAFTREQLFTQVWNMEYMDDSRTLDMHIRTLRKKLGAAGKYICTVRKVGYKLTDSEEELEQ